MRGAGSRPAAIEGTSPRAKGAATPKRSAGADSQTTPRRSPGQVVGPPVGREDGSSETPPATRRVSATPDRPQAKASRVPPPSVPGSPGSPSSLDEERWRVLGVRLSERLSQELEVQVKVLSEDLQESLARSMESLGKQQSEEMLGRLQALEELQTAGSEKLLRRLEALDRDEAERKLQFQRSASNVKDEPQGGKEWASLVEELLERLQALQQQQVSIEDYFSNKLQAVEFAPDEELRRRLHSIEERQVKAEEELPAKLEALAQQQTTANKQLLGKLEEQRSASNQLLDTASGLAEQQAARVEQLLGQLFAQEEQRGDEVLSKLEAWGDQQATATSQSLQKLELRQVAADEQLLSKLEILEEKHAVAGKQLVELLEERQASFQARTSHRYHGLRRDTSLEELHPRLPTTPELPEDGLCAKRSAAMHARFSRELAEPLLHGQPSRTSSSSSRRRSIFPNADEMKARVRETISAPSSCEEEGLYKNHGWAQRLARSHCFKDVSLVVIGINCIWIAVETDYNKAPLLCDAPMEFQIVDNLFCAFFVYEIVVRVLALQKKSSALKNAWFVFDLALVGLMVWETWILVALYIFVWGETGKAGARADGGQTLAVMRIFRSLRLMRVARMARVLRALPELMILVKGMAVGMRSVSATLGLLVMCIYVFAILFTELLSGTESSGHCFDTVPQSMNCLLLGGVFPDQAALITRMLNADWIYYFLVLAFLMVTSLTIMNLLIGVTCEVVNVVAQVEKEEMLLKDLKRRIEGILSGCDGGDEILVSREKFTLLMSTPDVMYGLHEAGVDLFSIVDFADFIFQAEGEIGLGKFLEAVLKFRGSNAATVKDVVDLRRHVVDELANIDKRLGDKH